MQNRIGHELQCIGGEIFMTSGACRCAPICRNSVSCPRYIFIWVAIVLLYEWAAVSQLWLHRVSAYTRVHICCVICLSTATVADHQYLTS